MRHRLAFARTLVLWMVLGLAASSLAYVAAGYLLGWRALTVVSGSMEPALNVGDVVVARRIPAAQAQPGQVVTFSDPSRAKKLITHRVRSVSVLDGTARFVTRGDANTGVERWSIQADGTVGLVERRVPKVGYVAVYARTRIGLLALLIPLVLIAGLELVALWRPPKRAIADQAHSPAEARL